MDNPQIIVEAKIDADIQKVWNSWNTPESITQWNFANDDWHCPKAEVDLRVGGKMKTRMEAKNGSFGFDFEGTYDEIVDQKKISYLMPDGRKVITNFETNGNACNVVTTFDAESQSPLAMQKAGWQLILNNFKRFVEGS